MSVGHGFRKVIQPFTLRKIQGRPCAICGEAATCAILSWNKVGAACETHGKRAKDLGFEVLFPGDGTLTVKRV
jgi:hypothetical protein